ncbi:MAG: hypothetical protein ACFB0E_17370 [Leptolyngbyaceae cyanobacterium]
MIQAQIGRLGFQELMRTPETVAQSLRAIEPRLWPFLGIAILVSLIQVAVSYAMSFALSFLMIPVSIIGGAGEAAAALSALLMVGVQLVILAAQMWMQARLFLWDMILAMEPDTESTAAITRSWELTKGSGARVLLVLLVAYLVMLPLYGLMLAVPLIIAVPFFSTGLVEGDGSAIAALALLLAFLVFLLLALVVGILTSPFFQVIKSVLYYDLRNRREGLDIQFRDRPHSQG